MNMPVQRLYVHLIHPDMLFLRVVAITETTTCLLTALIRVFTPTCDADTLLVAFLIA